jgi:hypothetical protein
MLARCHGNIRVTGRRGDVSGHPRARVEVAYRERHAGAGARERTRGLNADPGRSAGDDGALA